MLGVVWAGAPRHTPPAAAVPVATDDVTYDVMGRVFPDPHGCIKGTPGSSPWAKGDVCAVQYLQWEETLAGLRYLQERYPRFLELVNLRELRARDPSLGAEEMQSAGLPQEDLTRARRDLYVVTVTDAESPVPEADRKRFAYVLSIHGIERAGLEGGIRAAEDPHQPILEPSDSGPTARDVLRNAVVYFVLANPDGWHRGELTEGGAFFQRYNGNGMDLNRDFPGVGYTEAQYTPFSEPESRGFAAYLRREAGATAAGRFAGGIDLHGMLSSHSFSFTLLGAGQRDYRKNAISVDTSIRTFRDAEARLTWSPLVARAGECPGPLPEPYFGRTTGPMCTDQWGTVWDTINYQTTGSVSDWMDSAIGLDAVGIANEMALSHVYPNTAFDPQLTQLQIDGNKGLVYSQIASLLFEEAVAYRPPGTVGYVPAPARVTHPGGGPSPSPLAGLPAQEPISATEVNGAGVEFDVHGPESGVHNGSLTVEATFDNVRGVSPTLLLTGTDDGLVLERQGGDHAGDPEWVAVAHYFNQSGLYAQAGARIDLDTPRPGRYRIRPGDRVGAADFRVTFFEGPSVSVPDQAAYDVANTDFFADLNTYVPPDARIEPVQPPAVLASASALAPFDTVVLADDPAPGVPADHRQLWFERLRAFVEDGGNLVLTDGALPALEPMGLLPAGTVRRGVFFAGWIDFADAEGATYARHPLASGVAKEGAAEGRATLDDADYLHRHQTYEPAPLGYYVSAAGPSNAGCSAGGDRCDAPNWVVDDAAWADAGGSVAGRTFARAEEVAGSPGFAGVSLGELPVGRGRVRIAGALLPAPTEKNYHPFGLAAYAVTYTGYQLVENLFDHQRPRAAPPPAVAGTVNVAQERPPSGLPATGAAAPVAWALGLAVAALFARRATRP